MAELAAWLERIGLRRYTDAFAEAAIDLDVLADLSEADLEALGVRLGDRKRLLKAIAQLRTDGGTPVPPEQAAPGHAGPAAERRQLTVMFVDLVGSTALSRRLDPEDMSAVMRAYHARAAEVIRRWGGHVAKYLGDGVLAYFGWPQAHEDAAERAVRAGLGLAQAIAGLEDGAGEKLAVRMGIATGPVVVGELIGEGAAQEQAVVGETPNLAARLQALAQPGTVVISQTTRRLLGGLFELADLGPQRLKGFAEPLAAWQVEGEAAAESRFEALHGRRLTPLVGREHELGLLLDRWERANGGEGQVVLLAGEAGIGKSRLIQALRQRLTDEPHTPLPHYGSPHHTNSAFYPIIRHLERAAGFDRDDPADRRLDKLEALLGPSSEDLERAVSLLAPLLGLDPEERHGSLDLTPQRRKQLTLETLVAQVEALARERPVLVIYEDVHWFDPSSLEALGLLVERALDFRALVLITARPDFMPPWGGRGNVAHLSLTRLGRRDGAAMVARLTRGRALPPEIETELLARTDGVPLFVEELTKAVLESGLLDEAGDVYALNRPLPPFAIPSSLHDSLMARLDRLGPVREVAQIASVIGREFSHGLLTVVAGRSERELANALGRLEVAELIYRRGVPPEATYTFKHALVQDVAYQSLLKSRRQQLHAGTARAIQGEQSVLTLHEPEVLAYHLTRAGDAARAIPCWQVAARRASERSAHQEAIAHLQNALRLLDDLSASSDRLRHEIDLQTAIGTVLIRLRGQAAPEVGERYARAEELCVRSGDEAKLYSVLQGLWHFRAVRAELARARELAERCHAMAQQDGEPALRLAAHVTLCGSLCWSGDFVAARRHLDEALEVEAEAPNRSETYSIGADLKVFMRGFGSYAVWHLGQVERANRLSDEALDLARRCGDPFDHAMALDHGAMLGQFGGDHHRVAELAAAALERCKEHQFAYYLARAMFLHGWAQAVAGRVDHGLLEMQRGMANMQATGSRLRWPYYLALLAHALLGAGRQQEGLSIIDQGIALAGETGERWRDADLQRTRAALLLALPGERAEEAESCLVAALTIARTQNAKSLELQSALDLARLWAEQEERQKALDLLAPVYDWFTEGFDTRDLKAAKALLEELT